jgi:hypothetical protein
MGVYLTRCTSHGRVPYGRASYSAYALQACISLGVHLTERAPHRRVSHGRGGLEAFRFFNLGFLEKVRTLYIRLR